MLQELQKEEGKEKNMKSEKELLDVLRKNAGAITYLENIETGEPYKKDETVYVFLDTESVVSFLMKLPDVKNYRLKTLEGIYRTQEEFLKELAYKVNVNNAETYDIEDKIEIDDALKPKAFEEVEEKVVQKPQENAGKVAIAEEPEEKAKPESKQEAILAVKPKGPTILEFKQELTNVEKIVKSLEGVKDDTPIYLVWGGNSALGYFTNIEDARAKMSTTSPNAEFSMDEEGNLFLAYYTSQFENNGESMVLGYKNVAFNGIKASLNEIGMAIQQHFEDSCISEDEIIAKINKGQNFWYDAKRKSIIRMIGTDDFVLFDDETKMDKFAKENIEQEKTEACQKAHVASEKAINFYEKELVDTKYVFFNGEEHCKVSEFLKTLQKVQK